jgi:hypothetical protein
MEASQHSLLAACFTLHSINATLAIVPQRGAVLEFTLWFLLLQAESLFCNTVLVVESATAIFNLITGLPEIYVRSLEVQTVDCRVVGIRLLTVEFLVLHVPETALPTFVPTGSLNIRILQKSFINQSTVKVT